MPRWITRVLGLSMLAAMLVSTGCYRMLTKEAKREHRWKKRMAKGPDGADGALRSARSLVRVPISSDNSTKFRYRMMAIRAITAVMESSGFDPELDAEARRYYEEALELGDRSEAARELARLYDRTGRRGKIAELIGDASSATDSYDGAIRMWRTDLAKGDLAASELAWSRAEELAATAFDVERAFPKNLGSGNLDATGGKGGLYTLGGTDWRGRYDVLRERMLSIASPHDSPTGRVEVGELARLWSQYERIGVRSTDDLMGRSYGDTYRVYVDGARVFAIAGQAAAARALLDIAEKAAAREVSEFRRADLACARAFVAARTGQADAVEAARHCLTLAGRSDRALEIADLVALGEAFEGGGELDEAEAQYRRAIERAERQRDSFPVEQRTTFFRTSVRRGYWGLARTLARRSTTANGNEQDFVRALAAIEQVRARQLGELLAGSGQRLGNVDSLASIRKRLEPGDVLLDYVAMDDEVLLLAVTRDAHAVRFLPLDAGTISDVTAEIADGLMTPTSNAAALDQALTLLGRALMMPVKALLDGKRRVIVLPDGPLNAVPFDLLDLDGGGYHPLVERMEVAVQPSLAFLLAPDRSRTGKGLLGVADPVYGAIPEVALADDRSRAAARAASAGYFAPLPETRREVESIARTLGGASQLLLGAEARESTIKAAPLDQFGIVHFATHGILGRDVPGIDEPALVLAGEPGEDGFLTASEASKLRLDAGLTVLSACKTGAGDSASGEGVLGMSRAFMIAGSRAVLVSLWSVDSLATEALMVEFYRRMHAGATPAAALRMAKLAVREGTAEAAAEPTALPTPARKGKGKAKDRGMSLVTPPAPTAMRRDHPYYWGAFILVGG